MDRTDVAYLIQQDYVQNGIGAFGEIDKKRKVYVHVNSVSGAEWFEGGRNGLNLEFRFTMWKFDYQGEEVIKYKDQYYQIYRTYLGKNDMIELYCEKRKGNADKLDKFIPVI